ncbi:MAG: DUF6036 family nucleotidyltransferase [Terriglobia bacterium]
MPTERFHILNLPPPWARFFRDFDTLLPAPVRLHCLGGFVLAVRYGLARPTADVDVVAVFPMSELPRLEALAGRGSPLARKHHVNLQYVGVASLPENYEKRLFELLPGRFRHLRLFVPDPYDLMLSKLERNSPKDREDVEFLAKQASLRPHILRRRYQKELRPYLARAAWHDATLELWLDTCFPGIMGGKTS